MTIDYSKPETLPCGLYLVRGCNQGGTPWHTILTKCPEGWFSDGLNPEMWGLDEFGDEVTVVRSLEDADALARDLALVEKLPRTADGVPVSPGMDVWCAFRQGIVHGRATGGVPIHGDSLSATRMTVHYDDPIDLTDGGEVWADESDPTRVVCYSTERAAREAKERGE